MAVNDNIDTVLFHNSQVGLCVNGLGSSEHNVGKLGAAHGAAPAVGHTGAQRLAHQGLRLAGIAHMSHMHGRGNLPVNGSGLDLLSVPDLLGMFGSSGQPALHSMGLSVFQESQLRHLMGQVINIFPLGFHTPLFGDPDELLRIFYLIVSVCGNGAQSVADFPAMIGMGGCSAGHKAQEISAGDAVGITAADSSGGFGGNTAGSHGADAAANALLPEFAVGGLIFYPHLPGIGPHLSACLQQPLCGCVELVNGRQLKITHTCSSLNRTSGCSSVCLYFNRLVAEPESTDSFRKTTFD